MTGADPRNPMLDPQKCISSLRPAPHATQEFLHVTAKVHFMSAYLLLDLCEWKLPSKQAYC
jgi:hypothetical protein